MPETTNFESRITERAAAAAVQLDRAFVEPLAVYLGLLARWNRRINLTAFELDHPSDAAIDRLIVEPVRAGRFVRPGDAIGVDIGSGGGSPAFPLKIVSPGLRLVLVESRTRKAAFLREVARTLQVDVEVESCRFEDVASRGGNAGRFDLVSVRAVRVDEPLWKGVERVMAPGGRLLWFGHVGHMPETMECFSRDVGLAVLDRPQP